MLPLSLLNETVATLALLFLKDETSIDGDGY
jgi:hypothetical protein